MYNPYATKAYKILQGSAMSHCEFLVFRRVATPLIYDVSCEHSSLPRKEVTLHCPPRAPEVLGARGVRAAPYVIVEN